MANPFSKFMSGLTPSNPADLQAEIERRRLEAIQHSMQQGLAGLGGGLLGGGGGGNGGYVAYNIGPFAKALNHPYLPVTKKPLDIAKLDALKTVTPRKVLRPTPDYVAPLVAWRAWKAEGGKLHALGVTSVWEPKKAVEATCNHGSNHESPQSKCECGIWAFKTLELLTPALEPYEVKILGQVSLWGRVIETENGFRAQYAYPKELWLLDESLEQLGYVYGVPVRMVTA